MLAQLFSRIPAWSSVPAGMAQRTFASGPSQRYSQALEWYNTNVRPHHPEVPEIDAFELKKLIEENREKLLLVDTRTQEEIQVSKLAGSIPLEEFSRRPVPEDKTIIFYCLVGRRSGLAAQAFLAEHPEKKTQVKNFDLSMIGWTHAGGELVDGSGKPTTRVHGSKYPPEFWPESGYEIVPQRT
eukprot:GEMP01077885.1.p1 GENE.GEMP01077885.1~~GEMP01077885.1.p1  ORF type:complete len:184 (+),score=43.58 GEMP01077885.1:35-586(+)